MVRLVTLVAASIAVGLQIDRQRRGAIRPIRRARFASSCPTARPAPPTPPPGYSPIACQRAGASRWWWKIGRAETALSRCRRLWPPTTIIRCGSGRPAFSPSCPTSTTRCRFDPYHDLNPIVSVSDVVLAISMPASMHVDTMAQLVALARSEPGKLNAAAANGISDFLLFGFFKNLGLEVAHVPYRDIMQAPGDLAEGRIQVLSIVARRPATAGTCRPPEDSAGDQQAARARRAGHSDRRGSRLSGADIRKHRRRVRAARHAGHLAREHRGGFPRGFHRSRIASRLASFGTIMNIRGPAEFAASIQEQRDKLAALAKTLGIKAAQ